MKPRFLANLHVIAFVLASPHQAIAESATWNGTSDALWSNSTNWSASPVPGTGDIATFDNAGNSNTIINLDSGVTIGSILFATSAVGAYTIGSIGVDAQSLTLDDGGSITANNGINANQVFQASLTLGADGSAQPYYLTNSDSNNLITFTGTVSGSTGGVVGNKTINVNSASSAGVAFNGLVSNGGATSLGIVKTGSGVLALNTVAHTISGGLAIEAGTLNFGGSGSANNSTISLGAAGQTSGTVRIGVINSGTNPSSPITVVDQTSGTPSTRILGTNSSTSGQWSGPITMNEDFTVSTLTAGGFTLNSGATVNLNSNTLTLSNASSGSAANVSAKGKISGNGNVVVSNTSTGTPTVGLVILEADNDYTGTTSITTGTLQVGNGGSAGSISSTSGVTNDGILVFKRTGSLSQGGAISGTGLVRLTGSATVTFDKANTYSGTTTVQGGGKLTITGTGSINPTTGAALNLGSGGSAGTLQYDSSATSKFGAINVGNGSGNSGTLNQTDGTINGASLSLGIGLGSGIGVVSLSGGSMALTGAAKIGSRNSSAIPVASTLTLSNAASFTATSLSLATDNSYTAAGTVTQGGTSTVNLGVGALSLAGFNSANAAIHTGIYNLNGGTLTAGSVSMTAATGPGTSTGTFNFNGGTLTAGKDNTSFMPVVAGFSAKVQNGGAKIDTAGFDITISQDLVKADGATTDTLTKDGLGKLTLAGTNTYTGATTVNAGTLQIIGSLDATAVEVKNNATLAGDGTLGGSVTVRTGGHLAFDVAAITGSQFPMTLAGALNLEAGNVIDLTAAAPPALGGPYILLTAPGGITGTPGTVTLNGLSGSVVKNGNNLELTVTAPAGFADWVATPGFALAAGDQDPTDDPDKDGMDNLLEFVLNGNPSVSDSSILPSLNVTATDFEFTYQRRDDSVSPETTQTFQWGTTLATWPGSAAIPAGSGPVGAATVTVSDGTPDDAVTDTVKISIPKTQDGGSGKLFGRLQVVKP